MKIGLTGGIGSGKTTVSDYLLEKGYPVIDADKIAREITLPGSPVLDALAAEFGSDIIGSDGTLDRKLLGERAFRDEESKNRLDAITHGEICRRICEALKENREPTIFLDAALLYETDLDERVDQVWLVVSSEDLRVHRVVSRDRVAPDHVRSRITSQMAEEEKRQMAHVIIENNGTKEELYQKIDKLLNQWEKS